MKLTVNDDLLLNNPAAKAGIITTSLTFFTFMIVFFPVVTALKKQSPLWKI